MQVPTYLATCNINYLQYFRAHRGHPPFQTLLRGGRGMFLTRLRKRIPPEADRSLVPLHMVANFDIYSSVQKLSYRVLNAFEAFGLSLTRRLLCCSQRGRSFAFGLQL